MLKNTGPDAPVVVNEQGGKQSAVAYRVDLMPPQATLHVSEVLKHGADKYGANNWHAISVAEHLNHMLIHCFAYLAGDKHDDHLGHMACRAMMALEIHHRTPQPAPAPVVQPKAGLFKVGDRVEVWDDDGGRHGTYPIKRIENGIAYTTDSANGWRFDNVSGREIDVLYTYGRLEV
jgi:Domain of unknown function (DUF5664)